MQLLNGALYDFELGRTTGEELERLFSLLGQHRRREWTFIYFFQDGLV